MRSFSATTLQQVVSTATAFISCGAASASFSPEISSWEQKSSEVF
jgi:hypothetical protein